MPDGGAIGESVCKSLVAFGHRSRLSRLAGSLRLWESLDLEFLLDDRQAALVNERARPRREREDPVVLLLLVLDEERHRDRRVEALLSHDETLVADPLDRRVSQIEHTERPAYLLLGIYDGEVLDARPVNLHLDTLTVTVRAHEVHVAAHVLGVPARVDVRLLQTRMVQLKEARVRRYVGRHCR